MKSRNNKITKRGNHAQRVKSHDEYLVGKFPGFSNMTNPYSAVVAEMIEEEIQDINDQQKILEGEVFEAPAIARNVMDAAQQLLIDGEIVG